MPPLALDSTDAAQRLFARIGAAGMNMEPLLRGIGMEMETRVAERFESRSDPSGVPWVDLSARTLKRKKGRGSPLVFTGQMLDSLNHRVGDGWVEIGFGQPYAAFHEYGTRKMPRRGLLSADPNVGSLGDGDRQAIMELAQEHLAKAIKGG